MKTLISTIAIAATLATVTGAKAQEAFTGECKSYTEAQACTGSGWCSWRVRKAIKTPDGKDFTPKAYCAFKPNMKAAYAATR